ncbi:MAG TPA: DNA polymerase Y family protein [Polyangiaceae bacterium]|nr:DNA polymerase Y family protein [Polyangiaceae bacterium]
MTERRVVAVVLPDLLTELATARLVVRQLPGDATSRTRARNTASRNARSPLARPLAPPLGVVLVEESSGHEVEDARETPREGSMPRLSSEETRSTAVLAAVNSSALRFGVRAGQTVVEASAFVARLVVKEVSREELRARLGEIAEVALSFGPTVAFEEPDTVWVDVTGAAHLAGGEDASLAELSARVQELGHRVKVAVAGGPRLAQAFARYGRTNREGCLVVPSEETKARMAELPVRALPVDPERVAWLVRLGVLTVGAVSSLPRAAAAARLGEMAAQVLELAEGRDSSPLVAYVPPAIPREESSWDEPIDGIEPLLFVLRGLVSRLSARLSGRGEAVQAVSLVVVHDAAVCRLRGVPRETTLHFDLAAPIYRPEELFRVVSSRLGRTELVAAAVALRLEARAITRALALQLGLSRFASGLGGSSAKGPETLPVLLGELLADLGKERVGVLSVEGSHRPEKKSRLVKVTPAHLAPDAERLRKGQAALLLQLDQLDAGSPSEPVVPTRLFPKPIPVDCPIRRGATIAIEHRLFTVEKVTFERRLDAVEWWSPAPISRDYLRVLLRSPSGVVEAILYRERDTGARLLQAVCD